MHLPLFIARRYLFAKKSHNVINIISAISAIGMAIGTAALIIVLSVYNGFDDLIEKSLDDIDPDLVITPSAGKVFVPDSSLMSWLDGQECVDDVSQVLKEKVFLDYDGAQGLATAKGIEDLSLHKGDLYLAAAGSALAYKLGINPAFVANLKVYFPDRKSKISMTNPGSSLESVSAHPARIFSVNSEEGNEMLMLPIEAMRELLGYSEEVSGLEIRYAREASQKDIKVFRKELRSRLGDSFIAKDRYQQNEALYKMMRYEKAAIFLILMFIIIIIATNVFGSLSMLIIEKEGDIGTFRSMGADGRTIRRFFILEGWFISFLGLAAGLVAGLALAFIQQKSGLISIPGNYLISAYPVIVKWGDVALTAAGVAIVGYLIALIPSAKIQNT